MKELNKQEVEIVNGGNDFFSPLRDQKLIPRMIPSPPTTYLRWLDNRTIFGGTSGR
jgi:hypothetical protein